MEMTQNHWGSDGWRQDSLPPLVEEVDFATSEGGDEVEEVEAEVEMKQEEVVVEEEVEEVEMKQEGDEDEDEAMVDIEEEESDSSADLSPDDLVESIEEDEHDLSGRLTLFHLAYEGNYPYCGESHAFQWTEIPAHLTVEKIRQYDHYAFWKDTELIELDGKAYLQHNLTGELLAPESMPDPPSKSWCCGRRFCWGHGINVEWI